MTTLPPDHPRMRAWRLRARSGTLWEMKRFPEAARAAQESLEIEPDSAQSLCMLAQAQSGMGQTLEALASARRACAAEPGYEGGYRLSAIYHGRLGETAAAVAAAREAVRCAPDFDMTLAGLVDALVGAGDLEEGLRVAQRICEVTPESVLAYERCGNIVLEQKQYAEAEAYFRRGLALDPQHNVCLANLGWALVEQGRPLEAIDCFVRALRLHPDDEHVGHVRQQLQYTIAVHLGDRSDFHPEEAITSAERQRRWEALPAPVRQWYATSEIRR